jgi:hypothetical protein
MILTGSGTPILHNSQGGQLPQPELTALRADAPHPVCAAHAVSEPHRFRFGWEAPFLLQCQWLGLAYLGEQRQAAWAWSAFAPLGFCGLRVGHRTGWGGDPMERHAAVAHQMPV